jgi:hypothetical protein
VIAQALAACSAEMPDHEVGYGVFRM